MRGGAEHDGATPALTPAPFQGEREPIQRPHAEGSERGDPLLEVQHLTVRFPIRKGLLRLAQGHVTAVDDVSFDIRTGETLALVGESG